MAKASLSDEQKSVVFQMSKVGVSQKKIANAFDVSQPTISNAIKEERFKEQLKDKDDRMLHALEKGATAYLSESMKQKATPELISLE